MEGKLIEKGVRLLREYLNSQNENLSVRSRNRLFAIIESIYRGKIFNDKEFSNKNIEFLSKRRTKEEKDNFYFEFMSTIHKEARERYYIMYPGE